ASLDRRVMETFLHHDEAISSFSGPALDNYGSAVPDLDFTSEMSALSMNPSAFMSSRELRLVTVAPDCDLVWLISAEFTNPSAFVSPISTPIVAETPAL